MYQSQTHKISLKILNDKRKLCLHTLRYIVFNKHQERIRHNAFCLKAIKDHIS